MSIRELRVPVEVIIAALCENQPPVVKLKLPPDARVTDVALDHHGKGDHRGEAPTVVLQISSGEFSPEDASRPILPMSFRR
jgi:hypothetical protein